MQISDDLQSKLPYANIEISSSASLRLKLDGSNNFIILKADNPDNGLFELAKSKSIILIIKSLKNPVEEANLIVTFTVNFEIYLSNKLEHNSLSESPSDCLRMNQSTSSSIHTLMTEFYFSIMPVTWFSGNFLSNNFNLYIHVFRVIIEL